MAQAGAALGGSVPPSLPPSAAQPSSAVVVQPGDSLWSVAHRLAPGSDPRPVVDALAAARHGAPLRARGDGRVGRLSQSPVADRPRRLRLGPGRRGCARVGGRRRYRGAVRCPFCTADDDKVVDSRPADDERRDPAPPGVPRLRPAVHHLRAGRGAPADGREAVGGQGAVRREKLARRDRAGGRGPCRSTRGRGRRAGRRDRGAGSGRRAPRSRSEAVGSGRPGAAAGLDPVSYLRFASVYKGFEDLADFEREVVELQKTTAPKRTGECPLRRSAGQGRSCADR